MAWAGISPSSLEVNLASFPVDSYPTTPGGGGAVVNNIRLQITAGTLLTFAVNDPNVVIVDTALGPPITGLMPLFGGNFRIGVMLGPFYARAEFSSQKGTVRSYSVAAPKNAALTLFPDTQLRLSSPTLGPVVTGRPSLSILTGNTAAQTVNLEVE